MNQAQSAHILQVRTVEQLLNRSTARVSDLTCSLVMFINGEHFELSALTVVTGDFRDV